MVEESYEQNKQHPPLASPYGISSAYNHSMHICLLRTTVVCILALFTRWSPLYAMPIYLCPPKPPFAFEDHPPQRTSKAQIAKLPCPPRQPILSQPPGLPAEAASSLALARHYSQRPVWVVSP
jgi:hypothetical protein